MESLRGPPDGDPGAGRIDWTTFVDFTNLAAAGERRGWRTVCRAQSRKNRNLDLSQCFFNVSSMFLQCFFNARDAGDAYSEPFKTGHFGIILGFGSFWQSGLRICEHFHFAILWCD